MNQVGIEGIAYYLPETVLTNEDIACMFPEWDPKRAERITGIKERRLEKEETAASDMALAAAQNLISEYRLDKSQIDFIIVVTQSADYRMPATACIMQDKLGLPTSTGAMDINLGCSGYIYGLATAKALVETNVARKVLLVTVEKTSFFMHPKDSTLRALQGDAATATLVSKENIVAAIDETDFGTDGSAYENIIVPYGGTAEHRERARAVTQGQYPYPDHVNMKGLEIFNFSVGTVPKTIDRALSKNGLELEDIRYFVLHQANKIILKTIGDSLKIPEEKLPMNIDKVGNTSSCSIPILLADILSPEKGKATAAGDRILLCGFGVGLSWGTTVLTVADKRQFNSER